EGELRLDPSNKVGVISIREIAIIDKKSDEEIWKADIDNQFRGCKVLQNDKYFLHQNYLIILAATDDPQILLNLPVINRPAKMRVTLRYADNIAGEDQAVQLNQNGMMKGIKKIFQHAKAVISN
nr:hypothetical protein [Bacteroidota bacterium]